jgi:hypothetical protein
MAKELRDEGGRHHHLLRSAEEKEKSKTHNRIYPTTRQARHATGAPPPGDQRPPEMEGRGDPARRDVALERALQGKHRERDFERKKQTVYGVKLDVHQYCLIKGKVEFELTNTPCVPKYLAPLTF